MALSDVLLKPIVTEKSASHLGTDRTYAFQVGVKANKHQVAEAIESFYGVKVETVRTMVVRGKVRRFGRFSGKRKNWKKAYVTLAEGEQLNLMGA